MELTIKEITEFHRNQARNIKAIAVGWGGPAPGTFEQREAYRFHCDAVETLENLNQAGTEAK